MIGGAAKSSWVSNNEAGIAANMKLIFREITKANSILHGAKNAKGLRIAC
jgi:hypothetical protein